MTTERERNRQLNDGLRQQLTGNRVRMGTNGQFVVDPETGEVHRGRDAVNQALRAAARAGTWDPDGQEE